MNLNFELHRTSELHFFFEIANFTELQNFFQQFSKDAAFSEFSKPYSEEEHQDRGITLGLHYVIVLVCKKRTHSK